MPLDKSIHLHLSGNPTASCTGTGNRPDHGTLLDLPLNEAIPMFRARQSSMNPEESHGKEKITSQLPPVPKIHLRKVGSQTYSLQTAEMVDNGHAPKIIFKPPSAILARKHAELLSAESSAKSLNTAIGYQIPEYPKWTPYQAVGYLAEKGMPIELQIGKLKNFEDQPDQLHKWRCMIISGRLTVMVDSTRKQVAKDMAAVKFLERLAETDKRCKIPKYTILPELLIDPQIFYMLEKEAKRRNLNIFTRMKTRPVKISDRKEGRSGDCVAHLYISIYYVGMTVYKGESFVLEFAKLLGAKRVYEDLTKTEVPPTKYFTGGFCDPTLEYDFGESEIHHGNPMISEVIKIPKDADQPMKKKARV